MTKLRWTDVRCGIQNTSICLLLLLFPDSALLKSTKGTSVTAAWYWFRCMMSTTCCSARAFISRLCSDWSPPEHVATCICLRVYAPLVCTLRRQHLYCMIQRHPRPAPTRQPEATGVQILEDEQGCGKCDRLHAHATVGHQCRPRPVVDQLVHIMTCHQTGSGGVAWVAKHHTTWHHWTLVSQEVCCPHMSALATAAELLPPTQLRPSRGLGSCAAEMSSLARSSVVTSVAPKPWVLDSIFSAPSGTCCSDKRSDVWHISYHTSSRCCRCILMQGQIVTASHLQLLLQLL